MAYAEKKALQRGKVVGGYPSARLANTEQDYARLGTEPGAIKPWEDGLRTDGGPGTYEWWYFDAHLADGATLVLVFLTKQFTDIAGR